MLLQINILFKKEKNELKILLQKQKTVPILNTNWIWLHFKSKMYFLFIYIIEQKRNLLLHMYLLQVILK